MNLLCEVLRSGRVVKVNPSGFPTWTSSIRSPICFYLFYISPVVFLFFIRLSSLFNQRLSLLMSEGSFYVSRGFTRIKGTSDKTKLSTNFCRTPFSGSPHRFARSVHSRKSRRSHYISDLCSLWFLTSTL